jgi:hypothetical protein
LKKKLSIQIKTSLLLFVFLLNTMVVSACSLGMDMKFSSNHHDDIISSSSNHHHEKEVSHHENDKDNCCKDEVSKIIKGDKIVQQSFDYKLLTLPLFTLPNATYFLGSVNSFPINTKTTYAVWRYRPPISDIRISIQSFQI